MSVRKAKYATPIVLAMLLTGVAAHAEDKSDSATQIDRAYKDAVEQRLEGDLQGAASTLGQLVLVTPDDARILAEYGKVLAAQGRADDALAFLRRSAQLQPNDWTVYSAMGIAFDQKANYKSAKIAYDRALMMKPGDPSVLSNAGVSRMLAGDLDGAEQMLAQASVEGKDPKIATNLALVRSLKAPAPQAASATKAAPVKQASLAPAAPVVAAKPAPAPVAASKPAPAPAPVAANMPAPAKPMAKNTYEALKNDPTVRMAPIPREEAATKPAPAPHVAAVTPAPKAPAPHVAAVKAAEAKPAPQTTPAAPHVLLQAPATKVAAKPAPLPVATAAPQPLVKDGALKVEKTAAKEAPKPVVITGKPKTPPVETAMLRPTVTDVTPVAATAHKNTAPQAD